MWPCNSDTQVYLSSHSYIVCDLTSGPMYMLWEWCGCAIIYSCVKHEGRSNVAKCVLNSQSAFFIIVAWSISVSAQSWAHWKGISILTKAKIFPFYFSIKANTNIFFFFCCKCSGKVQWRHEENCMAASPGKKTNQSNATSPCEIHKLGGDTLTSVIHLSEVIQFIMW